MHHMTKLTASRRSGPTVVAAVLGVTALLAWLGSGLLLAIDSGHRDADGYFTSRPVAISTDGYAIASNRLDLTGRGADAAVVEHMLERVRVRASSLSGKPIFVGVGRSRDVRAYLSGVAGTRVTDVRDNHTAVTRALTGTRRPDPPSAQTFWKATATGDRPSLAWSPRAGDWTVAVLNADGSAQVGAAVRIDLKTDVLRWLGVALLAGGVASGMGAMAALRAGRG